MIKAQATAGGMPGHTMPAQLPTTAGESIGWSYAALALVAVLLALVTRGRRAA